MDMFSCEATKKVVYDLMSEQKLKDKIFVAGGIVPWVLSDGQSGRKHSDIDIVVEKNDMGIIREYLKSMGYYQSEMDSMCLAFNNGQHDYGVEVFIDKIPVNFAPYEVDGNNIIQRNFSLESLAGFDALLTATLENIQVDDYVTFYTLKNKLKIGAYTLEAVQATKEKTNREKDCIDLQEIKKIGINLNRYNRIKQSIQNMKISFITKEQ